jgi:hypothetical protein
VESRRVITVVEDQPFKIAHDDVPRLVSFTINSVVLLPDYQQASEGHGEHWFVSSSVIALLNKTTAACKLLRNNWRFLSHSALFSEWCMH